MSEFGEACRSIRLPQATKVGLLYGTGKVAQAIARRLMQTRGLEIILFVRQEHPQRVVRDLEARFHDWAVKRFRAGSARSRVIVTQDESQLKDIDIVINCAGMSVEKAQKDPVLAEEIKKYKEAGKNPRAALLRINLPIAFEIAKKINDYCCGALIIQVANPMTGIMSFLNGLGWFKPNQIIGLGDIVDLGRLEELVYSEFIETAIDNFSALALGQHGAGIVVPLSSIRLDGKTINQFAQFIGGDSADNVQKIIQSIRTVADVAYLYLSDTGEIPYESPAAAAGTLVEALIDPLRYHALSIVVLTQDDIEYYGVKKGEAVVMQVQVGKGGVLLDRVAEVELTHPEKEALAKTLSDIREELKEADQFLHQLAWEQGRGK